MVRVVEAENLVEVGGLSEANAVVAEIKLGVVWADKDFAQDPEGTRGWGNIQPKEATETDSLAQCRHLSM